MKKFFIILVLCLLSCGITYFISNKLDNDYNSDDKYNISIIFEDNEFFELEDLNKYDDNSVFSIYPYKFKIINSGFRKVKYQIKLNKIEGNISINDLDYVLVKDSVIISKGSLKDINSNVLYKGESDIKNTSMFDLYIYCNKDLVIGNYKYKLDFSVIKDIGPGF